MKKFIISLVAAFGLMSATSAMAGTAIQDNVSIDQTDCVLLGDTIKLNTSNSVHGAYLCEEASSTIKIGTCHEAGSRAETTENCVSIGTDVDGNTIWNDSSCGSTDDTFTFVDYRGFFATSSGGSIGTSQLGGNCNESQITGHANVN